MAIRTVCIPVAEVIEGGTKSEFYADLRKTLNTAVRVANICVSECLRTDNLAEAKCGKIYTYPAVSSLLPGASFAASNLARSVEKNYRQDRFLMINGKRSARTFRSQPWPLLNNKSTKTLVLEDSGDYVLARIKLLANWWVIRLAGGSNYRDQISRLRKAIVANSYKDSKIWTDRKGKAILGIACDVPTKETQILSGTMTVSSSRDRLLTASFERSPVPFAINADVVKTWQAEANRRQGRLRQDRKSGVNRKKIRKEMNAISDKMQRRMKTLCHQVAISVVKKAVRMSVATIRLDLTIKSYVRNFPWFDLKTKIEYKAKDYGIEVVDATQQVQEPNLDEPHIYFIYDQHSHRVKIGKTNGGDGRLESYKTFCPDALVLAIDNQPKSKLNSREKHWHSCFNDHRITNRTEKGNEVFAAEPVLAWLREADWLGNAGNRSQIMQVLDVSPDTASAGHLKANRECSETLVVSECSHKAVKQAGIQRQKRAAPAVTQRSFWD
jgi:hypothetical protein